MVGVVERSWSLQNMQQEVSELFVFPDVEEKDEHSLYPGAKGGMWLFRRQNIEVQRWK